MKITNISRASQGVHSTRGLVFIEPGETKDIEVAEDHVKRVKASAFLSLHGMPKSDAGADQSADVIAAKDAEIVKLKDRVAELELEIEELRKPTAPEAKHRGAGSYSIMDGESEVREKLSKDQAEAFNKLDAEGKAKWLAENPKAA
jgi:cell division protein FtsB